MGESDIFNIFLAELFLGSGWLWGGEIQGDFPWGSSPLGFSLSTLIGPCSLCLFLNKRPYLFSFLPFNFERIDSDPEKLREVLTCAHLPCIKVPWGNVTLPMALSLPFLSERMVKYLMVLWLWSWYSAWFAGYDSRSRKVLPLLSCQFEIVNKERGCFATVHPIDSFPTKIWKWYLQSFTMFGCAQTLLWRGWRCVAPSDAEISLWDSPICLGPRKISVCQISIPLYDQFLKTPQTLKINCEFFKTVSVWNKIRIQLQSHSTTEWIVTLHCKTWYRAL